jgi:hypothetical protein
VSHAKTRKGESALGRQMQLSQGVRRTERMDASASAASAVRSLSNTSVTRPSVTMPLSFAVFIRIGMMLERAAVSGPRVNRHDHMLSEGLR